MARYYFHLNHCGIAVLDEEGGSFRNLTAAREAAVIAAREMIGADACDGIIALNARIDIANAHGRILWVVLFKDVISFVE